MKASDIPSKFNIPFANSAGAGYKRVVPQASQIGINDGWASLVDGFPPLNFQPLGSGGVPPFGQDMNGLLNQITLWSRWQAAGALPQFDASFSTNIGGYPRGAILGATVLQGCWLCLVDDNTVNPDTAPSAWQAGWLFLGGIQPLTANVTFYVNGATGSDSYDGSSATHTSGTVGPFATIQKAVNVAAQFAPSTFGVTVNVAAGTYAAFGTPSWAHASVVINGAGTGSTTITSASASGTININGPNNYTLQNFTSGNSSGSSNSAVISSNNGANTSISTVAFTNSPGCNAVSAFAGGIVNLDDFSISGTFLSIMTAQGAGATINSSNATCTCNLTALSGSFATAASLGGIGTTSGVNTMLFVNPGNVTGQKYSASFNGVIGTQTGNVNYFPGTIAGATSTGGQYN